MNTFDFDKTLFYPDSSFTFAMWYYRRHPLVALICLPLTLFWGILYKLKLAGKEELKEHIYFYLRFVKDIDGEVRKFWWLYGGRIAKWYLDIRQSDDVVISASPEFFLQPIADTLGFTLIATRMDKHTGKITGLNCERGEKIRRFLEVFPEGHSECFYSDSMKDAPMAEFSDRAYMIVNKGQTPVPWPKSGA